MICLVNLSINRFFIIQIKKLNYKSIQIKLWLNAWLTYQFKIYFATFSLNWPGCILPKKTMFLQWKINNRQWWILNITSHFKYNFLNVISESIDEKIWLGKRNNFVAFVVVVNFGCRWYIKTKQIIECKLFEIVKRKNESLFHVSYLKQLFIFFKISI